MLGSYFQINRHITETNTHTYNCLLNLCCCGTGRKPVVGVLFVGNFEDKGTTAADIAIGHADRVVACPSFQRPTEVREHPTVSHARSTRQFTGTISWVLPTSSCFSWNAICWTRLALERLLVQVGETCQPLLTACCCLDPGWCAPEDSCNFLI